MKKENQKRKKFHIILTLAMAVLVIVLDVLFFALPDRLSSEKENRNLQQFPKMTWNTLTGGRFESQFDDYVADQFPFRDSWINVETTLQRLAGNTVSNNIYLGSDGYLIQGFDEASEEKYQSVKEGFTGISEGHGDISIYAMIVPTAVSVLDYRLPANAKAAAGDEMSFIRRLNEDLQAEGIQVIDVYDTLKALDAEGTQVYYRTDHHWTTDAAYEAYKVFAAAALEEPAEITYDRMMATDSFQGTLTASSGFRADETDSIYVYLPVTDQDEEAGSGDYIVINVDQGTKTASMYDLSYLDTRDKYAMFLGGNHAELKIQTPADNSRNILVIKDSYANCFIPFMAADFRNIIVIDPRYYLGNLEQLIADEGITDMLFLYNAGTL